MCYCDSVISSVCGLKSIHCFNYPNLYNPYMFESSHKEPTSFTCVKDFQCEPWMNFFALNCHAEHCYKVHNHAKYKNKLYSIYYP